MKNRLLILLTQLLPTRIARHLRSLSSSMGQKGPGAHTYMKGVDYFLSGDGMKSKRALVMLSPGVWLAALRQHPNIVRYNHAGFTYSLVKALNESGYVVDLADSTVERKLDERYDLFVGHGGYCRSFMKQLPEGIPIYQYISGLYWKVFEAESDERYERFFTKHGGTRPKSHRRSITPLVDGLEYLNRKADVLFTINCPRMVAAYGKYSRKFHFTGLGAYIDETFRIPPEERNFDRGRRNFIYVGGTGGNLQKGLDLLIEAFEQVPDLHLYIYCKVEEEIFKHCRRELGLPNIHYIYHWKHKPFQKRLRRLLMEINFSVHAPINIGMGTAFMATMGVGMIPVGYIDLAKPGESAVLCDSWSVDSLAGCIREASERSPEWCREASRLIRGRYRECCDPDRVEENFRKMFSRAGCVDGGGRE